MQDKLQVFIQYLILPLLLMLQLVFLVLTNHQF